MMENEAARAINQDFFSAQELAYLLRDKMAVDDEKREIVQAFKLFDVDNKGFINFSDLKRISDELGEDLKDEEIREMINEAATSSKGQVSEAEFKIVMKKTSLY